MRSRSVTRPASDTTPPTITDRHPAPNATSVPLNTNVTAQFSEPMNPATISSSSVHLRKQGSGTDVPAAVSYSGTTATLDPNADLDPNSVYTVTVDGSVNDQAGNALGAADTLELHYRGAQLRLHRHHRLGLRRGQPGRQLLHLPDRTTARSP